LAFFVAALGPASAAQTAVAPPELMKWPDLLKRAKPSPSATIRYGTDPLQLVDLWLPAGRGPHPTVLMGHGGCWQTEIAERDLMNWAADDLRRRGIAVWNIEYRGIDRPGGGYPGTFRDVAAAADALAVHAGRYRLDTRKVIAVGHSAGGHLALWLAARKRLPAASPLRSPRVLPIAAVVSLGGLPDLEEAASITNGCGLEASRTLAGGEWAETSVPRLAPIGVSQILINGLQDRIIPTRMATSYQRRMSAAGDDVTVRWVDRTGHVELIAPGSDSWADEMGRHADRAERGKDVLGDAIVEHALAADGAALLGIERGRVVLEILDKRARLRTLVEDLGLALVDLAAASHVERVLRRERERWAL
jgi:acetyl esterase/lipase